MLRRARLVALCPLLLTTPLLAAPGRDNLPGDVARSIAACWHPPHEGDQIALRLSFRRDGSVLGKPRITYMKAVDGIDGEAALATSIYAAIAACGRLRFTPSLGAAIAGRTFLIRFVAPRKELHAAL